MDNESEIEIEQLAEKIFLNSPGEPNSIQLLMNDNDTTVKEIADILAFLTMKGIKLLYGDVNEKVKLQDMSAARIRTINEYLNSFGFSMKIEINCNHESSISIDKNILSEYEFNIRSKNDEHTYTITFDYFKS